MGGMTPCSDAPSSTPLEEFLLKLEINNDMIASLKGKRITAIRKFCNVTPSFVDTFITTASYDALEVDTNIIQRFLPAHLRHMRNLQSCPDYTIMSIDDIDKIIAAH